MGYEKYQATPPKPEAAAHLQQMLDAMELAVMTLLDNGITSVASDIKVDLLPEEGGQ